MGTVVTWLHSTFNISSLLMNLTCVWHQGHCCWGFKNYCDLLDIDGYMAQVLASGGQITTIAHHLWKMQHQLSNFSYVDSHDWAHHSKGSAGRRAACLCSQRNHNNSINIGCCVCSVLSQNWVWFPSCLGFVSITKRGSQKMVIKWMQMNVLFSSHSLDLWRIIQRCREEHIC
jgi:hypothetical protein